MRNGLVALSLLSLAFGCIKRTPPVRLNEPQQVAVAYVVDSQTERAITEPPDQMKAAVEAELAKRNLTVTRIPFTQYSSAFEAQRDSARRYAQLKTMANGAPMVLLVELNTQFFSQLQGQYRWQVFARISAGKVAETLDPHTDAFEKPVFLQFDHQRGRDAMIAAGAQLAERVGGVFDGFLRGEGSTTATLSSVSPPQPSSSLGLVYFVMVDRFSNGDPSNDGEVDLKDPHAFHGGDLQGVINKLDYLKALGVDTVWLSPVFKMRTKKFFTYGAYHGYWTYDFTQVEPRFGDEQLLRKLSDELHARDMKLLLDVVLNHVGPDAPLVQLKPHWFHKAGALEKWDDPEELVNKDVHGLPDLAQENEEVYRFLVDTSLSWIDRVKPDGFRLDAVKHIPASFWARYNADVRKHAGKDFVLLGELLDGSAENLARVWREGQFTHMFDFPLHFAMVDVFCKGQPMSRLSSALSQDSLYENPANLVTLLDNHDLPRIASACADSPAGLSQALAFLFTVRGSPSIIWGTESGLPGAKEPENRADMQFSPQAASYHAVKNGASAHSGRAEDQVPLIIAADQTLLALGWLFPETAIVWLFNVGDEARRFTLPDELRPAMRLGVNAYKRGEPVAAAAHSVGGAHLNVADGAAYQALREKARRQWLRPDSSTTLSFKAAAPVEQGDALFVVGSGSALGAWKVGEAKGPFVDGQLDVAMAEGLAYEFKLVIRRKDGRTEWEPGSNRALFVPYEASARSLHLTWGERNG